MLLEGAEIPLYQQDMIFYHDMLLESAKVTLY